MLQFDMGLDSAVNEKQQQFYNSSQLKKQKLTKQTTKSLLKSMLQQSYKSQKYYLRKVRTVTGYNIPNYRRPYKFTKVQTIQFSIPSYLQVKIHKNHILKTDKTKIVIIPKQDFFNYQGSFKMSVIQMPINVQDFPLLVLNRIKQIRSINLWLYKGKNVTNWHYDGHDNFLYQLKGSKIVYLLPPRTIKSKGAFNLNSNHIYDIKQVMKYKRKMFKTRINQGECLYIPRSWWHCVISIGKKNMAVNFWGNSFSQIDPFQYQSIYHYIAQKIGNQKYRQKYTEEEMQDRVNEQQEKHQLFQEWLQNRVIGQKKISRKEQYKFFLKDNSSSQQQQIFQ